MPAASVETEGADRLAALWSWLASWIGSDGGVNGPIVHRSDLKRLAAIHDTPWTQAAVIEGLLHLYRRIGREYWLGTAVCLGDAQCARQVSRACGTPALASARSTSSRQLQVDP